MTRAKKLGSRQLVVENYTHFSTKDLHAFFLAGLRNAGCTEPKTVVVKYARGLGGGEAYVGHMECRDDGRVVQREAQLISRMSIPKWRRTSTLVEMPWTDPNTRPAGVPSGCYVMRTDASGNYAGTTAYRYHDEHVEKWTELDDDALLYLARVFDHEVDHTLGFRHPEMGDWWRQQPTWHHGLRVRILAAPKLSRDERLASVVAKREAHVAMMVARWERKMQMAERQLRSWTKKALYYTKRRGT